MAWATQVPGGASIDLCASGMRDFVEDPEAESEAEAWLDEPLRLRELSSRARVGEVHADFCRVVGERYGLAPEQVVPTFAASQAIMHACFALLRPGDHVIVERPTYEPLHRVPELLGANVSRLERTFDEGFRLVPDRLAKLLTPRTRAVVLTNLHNPSGVGIRREELVTVAEMAARVGALVLVDEVYLDYAFDLDEAAPWRPAALTVDNAVSWSSTTKAFGFAALRAGWLVTRHPEVLRDLRRAGDYFAVNAPVAGLVAAQRVLRMAPQLQERATRACSRGRAQVEAWLEREGRVDWVAPDAGASCVLRLPKLMSDTDFCQHLREVHDTQLVPGRFFDAPGTVRLSFALDPERLERGLENISASLDALD